MSPDADLREQALAGFLRLVGHGDLEHVRVVLEAAPAMANLVGPHPFWGGRPQPLHVAIETNRPEMFQLLLDHDADINGNNSGYEHWSPLMLAINADSPAMRDELLKRGAKVRLMEALLLADDARVLEMLAPGTSALPAYEPNAGSILNFARTPAAIDRLMELGVSTDRKDRWGSTPIDSMSRLGKKGQPLVRHMISKGVPAAPQEYARLGDQATLASLIAQDPAVARSEAVLMGAVDFEHHDLVCWLLAQGAPVNARTSAESHHTALHSAAWNGDLPMVKILVEAGADRTLIDDQHQGTPLGWAQASIEVTNNPKCREVAEYLTQL